MEIYCDFGESPVSVQSAIVTLPSELAVKSSHYRPPELLWTDEGTQIPAARGRHFIYAPSEPVSLVTDHAGKQAVSFPVDWKLIEHKAVPVAWLSGWPPVEFDASFALDKFLRLNNANDVQRFAQRFGPLWLCSKHHNRGAVRCFWPGHSSRQCRWNNIEPVDIWLTIRQEIHVLLAAAAKVRNGDALAISDFAGVEGAPTEFYPHVGRPFVATWINMQLHRMSPLLSDGHETTLGFELTLSTGVGFLPALWLQVASVCAGGRALAVCSGCVTPYVRKGRAPRRGQRNFCPSCNASGMRQQMSRDSKKKAS